jgi:isopenicillin-N N-acyltransferase-like protein
MTTPRNFPHMAALGLLLVWAFANTASADEPFRYPEVKFGKGELRHVNNVPILVVQGAPEDIGEQTGMLALKPASGLMMLADTFVKAQGWERLYPTFLKLGSFMAGRFPPDHLKELEAAAKASGWPRDLLVFGNTVPDLRKFGGCSVLMVEPGRSATHGLLFGRNLDWPPFAKLHEYTLVTVYRPQGKHAFASIAYPGMLGCFSGMNDAGLTLADLTVNSASDDSAKFNPAGTPYTLALRRVLEECATVEEAEKLLRAGTRTTMQNVAIADRKHGAVFEITTKTIVKRGSTDNICVCTNHFRSKELAVAGNAPCPRYELLAKSRESAPLAVTDVAKQMDAVNQGAWTQQTMVMETASLKLHLAFGAGPATRLPLASVDLRELFKDGWK